MKLKKVKNVKKLSATPATTEEKKPRKSNKKNTLPKEGYTPIFEPHRFLVRETASYKDGSTIKQYLEVSVKRIDDDNTDEATPYVWIQMYQESNFYTGYLRGKSVYFPVKALTTLIDILRRVKVESKGLTE